MLTHALHYHQAHSEGNGVHGCTPLTHTHTSPTRAAPLHHPHVLRADARSLRSTAHTEAQYAWQHAPHPRPHAPVLPSCATRTRSVFTPALRMLLVYMTPHSSLPRVPTCGDRTKGCLFRE